MRTASAAFATAQANPETTLATKVLVSWGPSVTGGPADISALFESLEPEADLTTDMPADSRQITGYTARSATLILSGTLSDDPGLSAQELFDAYSPSSVLYGVDWTGAQGQTLFTVYQGLADLPGQTTPEVYPIFSGYCTDMQMNRSTGQVTLTMIDTRIMISTVPQIPEVIAQYPASVGIIAPGLDSTWALDYLLRTNGVYSSPPPQAGCLFYMSGHGSLWPEIGGSQIAPQPGSWFSAGPGIVTPPTFQPSGAYGAADTPVTCLVTDSLANQAAIPFHTFAESVTNYCHMYFQLGIFTEAIGDTNMCQIELLGTASGDSVLLTFGEDSAGHLIVEQILVQRNGATSSANVVATGTATAGWQTVGIELVMLAANNIQGTVWINGTATTYTTAGTIGSYRADLVQITLNAQIPIDTVQLTTGFLGPPPAFTPSAFLDQSLNPLNAIPAYTNSDPWTLISDLCEAEFGTGSFDETQVFFFKNRNNRSTVPQLTVTKIKDLQYEVNESTRALEVISPVHPLGIVGPQVVYTQTGQVRLPPNAQTVVTCLCPQPVSAIETGVSFIPVGGISSFGTSWLMVNSKPDGTGAAITKGIAAQIVQISATVVKVFITNTNAFTVYLAPTNGYDSTNGVLAICGLAVIDNAATGNGVQVSASYGGAVPSLTLQDNIWRQNLAAVTTMVQDELSDLVRPRPMMTSITILGDARLQLGDRVQFSDAGEMANSGSTETLPAKIADDYIISSIHPTVDNNGFVQLIVARAIALPRQWVLGQVGKSELGATTWV